MNILYLDTETTGLDPSRHAIIQMAWIAEVDNNIEARGCYDCHPGAADICMDALRVNEFDFQRLQRGKPFAYVSEELYSSMAGRDGWRICAYNAHFDLDFLMKALVRCGDGTLRNRIDYHRTLDPLPLLRYLDYRGVVFLENYKLATVCEYFNIYLKAHDAMADVVALRDVWKTVDRLMTGAKNFGDPVSGELVEPLVGELAVPELVERVEPLVGELVEPLAPIPTGGIG